jgi:GH43 family beta-xylosidase
VEIKPDLSEIISKPRMLIYPQQEWEFNPKDNQYWNEGTVILKRNDIYYLMYSANCFFNSNYAM